MYHISSCPSSTNNHNHQWISNVTFGHIIFCCYIYRYMSKILHLILRQQQHSSLKDGENVQDLWILPPISCWIKKKIIIIIILTSQTFQLINTIFFKNIGTYCTFLRALWEYSSLVCHWQFNLLWASDCHNGQKNDHKDNLLQMSMGSNIQLSLFFLFLKLLMVLLLFEANTESDPPLLHIFWKKSNTKCKTSYKNIF